MKDTGIHTISERHTMKPAVSTLEAAGYSEPMPHIKALFSHTAKKDEIKPPNPLKMREIFSYLANKKYEKKSNPTLPYHEMREKILRMSLYPNIYNSNFLL